jgi:DNA polymerase-1
MSMVEVQKTIDRQGLKTLIIMQVHDELVFEVPAGEVEWVRTEVPRLMAGVAQLRVPLLAQIGIGPNWEQAHCVLGGPSVPLWPITPLFVKPILSL